MLSWEERVAQWSNPPVDDVGYFPSEELLALSDAQFRTVVERAAAVRYGGWRNHRGLWREVLGLDSTSDKDVLDFGCGLGLEALELARGGCRVSLADLSAGNLAVAERVLGLFEYGSVSHYLISDQTPFVDCVPSSFDVFYCNGVLHHIPWARQIMEMAHSLLRPNGEVRLMVYSDLGWWQATNTEPPADVTSHPSFERFVRHFDEVGDYADWYNAAKLRSQFGDLFDIVRYEYLTPEHIYFAAVLTKRSVSCE